MGYRITLNPNPPLQVTMTFHHDTDEKAKAVYHGTRPPPPGGGGSPINEGWDPVASRVLMFIL